MRLFNRALIKGKQEKSNSLYIKKSCYQNSRHLVFEGVILWSNFLLCSKKIRFVSFKTPNFLPAKKKTFAVFDKHINAQCLFCAVNVPSKHEMSNVYDVCWSRSIINCRKRVCSLHYKTKILPSYCTFIQRSWGCQCCTFRRRHTKIKTSFWLLKKHFVHIWTIFCIVQRSCGCQHCCGCWEDVIKYFQCIWKSEKYIFCTCYFSVGIMQWIYYYSTFFKKKPW